MTASSEWDDWGAYRGKVKYYPRHYGMVNAMVDYRDGRPDNGSLQRLPRRAFQGSLAVSGREELVVVVPCFNEERNVASAVASIQEVVHMIDMPVSILLVDDGSTDGTANILEILRDKHGCKILVNETNMGVGHAVLRAYNHIDPENWITIVPGDNEVVFESILDFIALRKDSDVVLGYLRNPVIRPLSRRLASFAFHKTVKTLYGFPFRYLNGMKLFRAHALQGIEVVARGHAFNAELFAKAILRNPFLRINEAPFVAKGRAKGQSKAIRPLSVFRALMETWASYKSVNDYRRKIVARDSSMDGGSRNLDEA